MFFHRNKFLRLLKAQLRERKLTLEKSLPQDRYIIACGDDSVTADLAEAREVFEKYGSTSQLEERLRALQGEFAAKERLSSFHKAKDFLRLMPIPSELVKDGMVTAEFSEGIKKAVGYSDDNGRLTAVTEDTLKAWCNTAEVVYTMADKIICSELSNTKITISELHGGIKMAEFSPPNKELSGSLILCSAFYQRLSPLLGESFVVAAPSMTAIAAFEDIDLAAVKGLGKIILNEYKWSDLPLTTEILRFDKSGVHSAGRFSAP